MPVEYGFLKYGKPLVAAAPILIGLNMLPSPAHACTGSANDPIFCFNNDGQIVNGFNDFYTDNLQGIPGASSVPGDTGYFVNPLNGPGVPFVTNTATVGDAPLSAPGVDGVPQLPGDPGETGERRGPLVDYFVTTPTFADGASVIIDPSTGQFEYVPPNDEVPAEIGEMIGLVDDDDAGPSFADQCQFNTPACQQQVGEFFIQVAPALDQEYSSEILDAALINDDDDGGRDLDRFFVFDQRGQFEEDSALADALVESLREEFGSRVEISGDGFEYVNDDDDGDFYSSLRDGGPFAADDDDGGDINSVLAGYSSDDADVINDDDGEDINSRLARAGYSSDDADVINDDDGEPTTIRVPASEPSPAERQLASLQRLRDRAEAETDPEKKQELEERVARFDSMIRSFGSSAIRAGLHNQDTATTPIPGRN